MGFINILNQMPQVTVPNLDPVVGAFLKLLNGGVGNICVTMILFTLMLKLLTFPLDFISRRSMKRNQLIQERLKPQLDKIEKQVPDKKQAQQVKYALMRKEGYKMTGACLPSIVTLVLFLYIFSALNSFTTYSNAILFNDLAQEYERLSKYTIEIGGVTQRPYYDESTNTLNLDGQELMQEKFQELNPSFLWIKNPWRADAWNAPIRSYQEFKSGGIGLRGLIIEEEFAEDQYNMVMDTITANSKYQGWNGWLILPILAAATSFLSQFISRKMQGPQPGAQGKGMQMAMMIMFPAMMLYFGVQYTAGFSMYIIFNSIFSTLSMFLIGKLATASLSKDKKSGGGRRGGNSGGGGGQQPTYYR